MEIKNKKNLIVYYSYSGNNQMIAQYLGHELNSDVCQIIEKNKRTGWTTFMDMLFRRTPKIQKLKKNLENYDHILFLAPLWAGKIANPLKSLLLQEGDSIKDYSFLTLCGGSGKTDQLIKVKSELQQLTKKNPTQIYELSVADLFSESEKRKVMKISKYRIKNGDLEFYKNKLKNIVNTLSSKDTMNSKEYTVSMGS